MVTRHARAEVDRVTANAWPRTGTRVWPGESCTPELRWPVPRHRVPLATCSPTPDDTGPLSSMGMSVPCSTRRFIAQHSYVEADLPAYFALARHFTLCDHYFSEMDSPSTPNHLMLIVAAAPIINNPYHHYRPNPSDMYD